MDAADAQSILRCIEREYFSIRFLKLTRMESDAPDRTEKIEKFFYYVKKHGMTEIMERASLAVSKQCMLNSRYATDHTGEYRVYYIMQ